MGIPHSTGSRPLDQAQGDKDPTEGFHMGTQAQCPCWTGPLPRGHCWGRGKSPDGQGATVPTGLSGTKGQMGRLALNSQGAASQEPRTRLVLPPSSCHAAASTRAPASGQQHTGCTRNLRGRAARLREEEDCAGQPSQRGRPHSAGRLVKPVLGQDAGGRGARVSQDSQTAGSPAGPRAGC